MTAINFQRRRAFSLTVTLLAAAGTSALVAWSTTRLGRPEFLTGYSLLGACIAMLLLSVRKRMIVAPLGSVAGWFQGHVYTGIFALAVFVMHVHLPIRGWFETLLALSFLWVSASGLFLWYLSRTTPRSLAALGSELLHEEIPARQARVAAEAYQLAVASTSLGEGVTLADHFETRLLHFFQGSRGIAYLLAPNGRWRRKLLRELGDMDRYLGSDGRGVRDQLCNLVRIKDDLDFHLAMQNRLRLWVTLHVSGIWMLVMCIVLHVGLVHRFHGGV